ncbi:MAG: divalent-cation tolerance protein CutA [Candidatus Diapherotrites archaeon]|nr:divalent-cation tolerance protein CutA [Candidatus Diapherotrites archaeon]
MNVLYVVCRDVNEAKKMGRILVEEKWAGCVNIFKNMESIFSWKEKVLHARESVMLVKTVPVKCKGARKRIEQLHSYKVPCIMELGVVEVNATYEKWLKKVCTG